MLSIDLTTDGHIHTHFCHHAVGDMEDYVLAALQKGLKRIIFLEHLECGIDYFESTWLSAADFAAYIAIGDELKSKYRDKIAIGIGIEVGYNPEKQGEITAFLRSYPWDRVGLSYHFYREGGRHLNMLSRKEANMREFSQVGVATVVKNYLETLLAAVAEVPADVVCHLDAVLRHHPDICFSEEHQQIIVSILGAAAEKGMALEVNTSGFAHRNQPYPAPWIIEKAAALGIELVAGSDAHRPQDVGRFFGQLSEFACLE